MITVTEQRSEFLNNDRKRKTIVVKFLGILIYKKIIEPLI